VITKARADRLVVISDLHLGNPFSKAQRRAVEFLRWAAKSDFDVCINGDGLEIAQASVAKMSLEIPAVARALKEVLRKGKSVYYVVGNHDIVLENFLEDWGALKVCPFLNLTSGSSRIRIEHGHLYDPFFVKHPVAYEFLTHLGGVFLKIHPSLYRLWISFEKTRARLRARRTGILGEPVEFAEAAHELVRRGFDAVIFGHTHHVGEIVLEGEHRYFNSGSWLISNHYIEIINGRTQLKEWASSTD
jgi:UDP-2,3-diacylglucosamine pyrophosphatase LpxH